MAVQCQYRFSQNSPIFFVGTRRGKNAKLRKEMLDKRGEGRYNITCALKALLIRAEIPGCGAVW